MGQISNPPSGPLPQPAFVAGRWYPASIGFAAAGTVGQNTIQFVKFIIYSPITISDLGCSITTALAANNIQLAIYASDPATGYPTGNALAITGNISTAATGPVSADITGANVALSVGYYWAAVNHSGTTSIVQGINSGFSGVNSFLQGSTTLANISSNVVSSMKLSFASTFNTWPDMTGQALTEALNIPCPLLFIKSA